MSDLIDKQTAIKIAESYGLNNGTVLGRHSGIADLIAEELGNLPTIEAEPVVHGEWIPHDRMTRSPLVKNYACSNCGVDGHRTNYCPNCGAKMDGGSDE